jgi:hypothetical protein
VRLIVQGANGDAVDAVTSPSGGYVVVPHPREDGWVIAPVDQPWRKISGTAPERVARIGLIRRRIPASFADEPPKPPAPLLVGPMRRGAVPVRYHC